MYLLFVYSVHTVLIQRNRYHSAVVYSTGSNLEISHSLQKSYLV